MIEYIEEVSLKREITLEMLNKLSTWFGLEDSINEYVANVSECTFFVFKNLDEEVVGFYALKPTSDVVLEIYVCGVLESYHRQGIGRSMFKEATNCARKNNYKFLQVKTVQSGHYDSYDKTNLYYQYLRFDRFEVIPDLWDEHNPCQIYIYLI